MHVQNWLKEKERVKKFSFVFAAFVLICFSSHRQVLAAEGIQNDDCFACHETMDSAKYVSSIHGSRLCTSCHSDIKELPHPEKLAPVQCATCHHIENEIYQNSDHGKAVSFGIPAAGCLSCHGEAHTLLNYRNPESPVFRLNIAKTCGTCHENQEKMAQYALSENSPITSYSESIHGNALLKKGLLSSAICTDCHGSHDLHSPKNPVSKIFPRNVPYTCGKCHENVLKTYERSIHGKAALAGEREAPVCTDCHGEHRIKSHLDPASSVYSATVSEKTCGHCHSSEKINTKFHLPADRVSSYFDSYHGLAGKLGATTVANCASCHGAHDVLPSSDPNSSVNKNNLPKTCGRCHPGAGIQLAEGSVHGKPSPKENHIVYFVSIGYVLLIIGVIGGMLFHNALDFFKKLRLHYQRVKQESTHLRFTRGERIQHFILVITFIVLAYTGFALKYSEAWWNYPFMMIPSNVDWRGLVHKAAAIVFIVLGIYHMCFMILTWRGRLQLNALLPQLRDFGDLFTAMKYYIGISKDRPHFERYNYIEKSEYWALIWGSVIMILTGMILTFENFFMKFLPKWGLDLATAIHFYEAVLATLAILVWHFYFVILDPECYPLSFNMVTGKVAEKEKAIENGSGNDLSNPKEQH
ncbi:MAG: hypothetical protein A3G33_10525 [Omnitrophica bacterium RIFCSPLOWO2_12_FULL_44_17]|uniref:Cytochrome b561 bacterial/Ni-hydrogenase domain-containing protein n=1 Tax=Candidatus Danuiimicrobium aquiferis TaxID=1801832 RepID=A0A1G1KR59_9BACT|nr:MAG: hypothetical protein A3B72_02840 [Omnitrophica bacterium RIFCSPHIGHO2_02_FULL_45_28]OGW88437.1 MAG: hypothetical protein A3E74_08200 [Omnitrophica bacterium RIFCSPHIGHO2_12_FULL_44_12]OGW95407.1 MAG: hypothetical protein A3G33_10525 [Omnitrophica bacterium RIFCSPLOWO2_12_FULL_44_17]OGX03290.1 MAG: hypothetical protein A3J12_07160 [Omnitrophica bacterium RIFCSPLOWO2_02_FULL_44_11]